tara:strand:+ start:68 stop:955 length:888 start_codon:yes stop_codon:yes gene_type:complete
MAVNKHFHTSNIAAIATEQSLYADLVAEAIQIHGHDVYYLDRTLVAEDTVLGEDSLSKFNTQAPIEMYMEDAGGGFAGERELMSQFGLQNLSEATFVVSKTRFQDKTKQIRIESGTDSTSSGSIQLESGTLDSSSKLEGEIFYIINETDATDADRPLEGDAIYHPILKKLFEINFVDHDDPFHQLDTNPVYKLRCRLFDYGSESLDTGITAIDEIESALSLASSDYQFTLEDETGSILIENAADTGDDEYLIQEDYIVGDGVIDKTAQNELFETLDDTVLDFSESNPFGDAGSAD